MEDETEWVILDTETDGLDYPIHAVEIAAQRMRGTEKHGESFRVFLNHDIPIPSFVTAIHGYTRDFLRDNGIDPRQAYGQLRSYVENRPVTAHFLRYDWNAVLLPELRRLGLAHIGQAGMCTWNLARRVLPEYQSHRLDLLREKCGLPTAGAHSAIGDIETVYLLLRQFIFPRLHEIGVDCYEEMMRFSLEKPLLKCHCLIQGKDYLEVVRAIEANRKQREARRKLLEECAADPNPALWRSRGLLLQDPDIEFRGRRFLFTGKMIWGSRSNVAVLVESVGGIVSDSKTVSGIDYLVLGEDAEKGWTRLAHGGKISDAVGRKIADDSCPLQIVLESDLIDCLMGKLQEPGQSATQVQL